MALTLAMEIKDITTIERLKETEIQKAFIDKEGYLCGYCTFNFIINAYALLVKYRKPN